MSAVKLQASAQHWLLYSRPMQHTGSTLAIHATARHASPGAGAGGAGVGTGTTGGTGGAQGQGQVWKHRGLAVAKHAARRLGYVRPSLPHSVSGVLG